MNTKEAMKILSVLQAAYPNAYKGKTEKDIDAVIGLWEVLFNDINYLKVAAALKEFMINDVSGFPPSPGQVMANIKRQDQGQQLTELEAWGLVMKAIKNSAWHSQQEFDKLPENIKVLIGAPSMLQNWAAMDVSTVQSVVMSNFMRSYKSAIVENNYKRIELAPPETVQQIGGGDDGGL